MAGDKAQNLQDTFLNHVRKTKTSVTIFLVNGVKLQGFVTWFDNFCLLLRRDGHSQLVYKHAISTIMPAAPIQMFEAKLKEAGLARDEDLRANTERAGATVEDAAQFAEESPFPSNDELYEHVQLDGAGAIAWRNKPSTPRD